MHLFRPHHDEDDAPLRHPIGPDREAAIMDKGVVRTTSRTERQTDMGEPHDVE